MKKFVGKVGLIEKLAKKEELAGLTKKQIGAVLEAMLPTIVETVKNDEEVRLMGFGTFKKSHRNARKGRNPQTGAEMNIPSSDALTFTSKIRY